MVLPLPELEEHLSLVLLCVSSRHNVLINSSVLPSFSGCIDGNVNFMLI